MARQQGFTRASALGPIADFVEQQGGLISRVLDDVDLPAGILENPDLPVPLPEQFRLLQRAARETGDAFFGARLGQHVRIEKLSGFGLWVSRADTVGGALDRSNRGLNAFLQTGTNLKLEEKGGKTRWSIEFLDPGFEGRFQNELLGLSYLIDVVRSFVGRHWTPDRVLATGTRERQASPLEQIFNAPVSTGNPIPTIEFDTDLLAFARPGFSEIFTADAAPFGTEQAVPSASDQYGAIMAVTSIAMLEGYPRIDWIAAKLGMTRRTMQRRLDEQGTTFSVLLDGMLKDRATFLVASGMHPITEIALRLGYADPAHFSRAFKRWTGVSPRAYRHRRDEPAASAAVPPLPVSGFEKPPIAGKSIMDPGKT